MRKKHGCTTGRSSRCSSGGGVCTLWEWGQKIFDVVVVVVAAETERSEKNAQLRCLYSASTYRASLLPTHTHTLNSCTYVERPLFFSLPPPCPPPVSAFTCPTCFLWQGKSESKNTATSVPCLCTCVSVSEQISLPVSQTQSIGV